jgi:hypothetical protein
MKIKPVEYNVRFQILTEAPCGLVEVHRRSRGVYNIHYLVDITTER